jgi:hypothetical protein
VNVITDDNLQSDIRVVVDDDTLRIEPAGSLAPQKGIIVDVVAPRLQRVELSGASTGSIERVDGPYLDLVLSGASHCKVNGRLGSLKAQITGASAADVSAGDLSDLTADCSGASNLKATGSASQMNITISGASGADLNTVKAQKATVHVSGASWCNLNVAGQVDGDASGASNVTLTGHPANSISTSGMSSVRMN